MKGKIPSHVEILRFLSHEPQIPALLEKYPALSIETIKKVLRECADILEQRCAGAFSKKNNKVVCEPNMMDVKKPHKGRWVVYIDGASRGNPGPAACGAWILTSEGVLELGKTIGYVTNNVAEYEALIMVLEEALARGIHELEIMSDSELLVKQIRGEYRAKKQELVKRLIKSKNLEKKLKYFNITFIPRELNKNADRLVNRILNEGNLQEAQ